MKELVQHFTQNYIISIIGVMRVIHVVDKLAIIGYTVAGGMLYERVQPLGLTSFSCNWVILHNEIDQM